MLAVLDAGAQGLLPTVHLDALGYLAVPLHVLVGLLLGPLGSLATLLLLLLRGRGRRLLLLGEFRLRVLGVALLLTTKGESSVVMFFFQGEGGLRVLTR